MALLAGYLSTTSVYKDDTDDHSDGGLAVGADFSVPFKTLNFSVGLMGWLAPPMKSKDTIISGSYLVGAYGAYLGDRFDVFFGPAGASMSYTAKDSEADTNKQEKFYTGIMGCGITGARLYFGQKGVAAGLGITGYYCQTSNYKKSITSKTEVVTDSDVTAKASQYGGMVFLFIGWDEERTLF